MLYEELAKYYDLIYHWKDYEGEAEKVKELIEQYKESDGDSLLEVGCGTGKHLQYLKDDYDCIGTDLNGGVLEVARKNVKAVNFIRQDMIELDLKGEFDIITCLFSSIGYVKTYDNLKKTIKNFYSHLKQGGVALIEAWFTREEYDAGRPLLYTYDGEELKIARVSNSTVKDRISIVNMQYLIAKRGEGVEHFSEEHELGLFETEEFLKIMQEAGFNAKYLDRGITDRGLYVGVKE